MYVETRLIIDERRFRENEREKLSRLVLKKYAEKVLFTSDAIPAMAKCIYKIGFHFCHRCEEEDTTYPHTITVSMSSL